jgi:NAD(P)H-hydrate epimerase
MKTILNGKEMKQADQTTIVDYGLPSPVLMERAALSVVDVMEQQELLSRRILVLCGMGNNGGDGFAVARLLHLRHCDVTMALIGDRKKMSADARQQYEICRKYQVAEWTSDLDLRGWDVFVDAIFGIGLSREIAGPAKDVILQVNGLPGSKVAVDMPSGVCADDGRVCGIAFHADVTVTFGFAKVGQMLYPGKKYCGKLYVNDIGIGEESLRNITPRCHCLEPADFAWFPKPEPDAHKGSRGKVLCIAGSAAMAGAAYLSGAAALCSGAGMVHIYTHSSNRDILLSRLPEALLTCYEDFDEKECLSLLSRADAVLIGSGMGTDRPAQAMLACVLQNVTVPLVMDADALNILSERPEGFRNAKSSWVITPHLGEMARLCHSSVAYVAEHKLAVCQEFAGEHHLICCLKDAATVTALSDGTTYLNASGCSGMATAGSGDVLAGIITGLIAQGMPSEQAAPFGVYIHGLAGEAAADRYSLHGMKASDLLEGLRLVFGQRGV